MISIIAAVGKNLAIGRNNRLIWNLPGDLPRFKNITTDHTVIMGDKTFESMNSKPLPNRNNIVLSLDPEYRADGCEVCTSLDEVMNKYKNSEEEVFVIGGGMIYKLALPYADKLYITEVDDEPTDADVFFPEYRNEFTKEVFREEHEADGIRYAYVELLK